MTDTRRKVAELMPMVDRMYRGHCWAKTANGPRRLDKALGEFELAEHVSGRRAYGLCPISPRTSTCRVACLDFDSHRGELNFDEMLAVANDVAFVLEQDGYMPHIFRSSGGQGIHLYLLWDEPQDAHSVRSMLNDAIVALGYANGTGGVAKKQIEIFPKQAAVPADGYGSMFILPFSGRSEPLAEFNGWQMSPPVPLVERPPKPERVASDAPEVARLRSALNAIPNDVEPLDYDDWRNVVFALHHATDGSDDGLTLAHEFSARSPKYDPDFLDDRVWPYVGVNTSATPVTERTLFAMAAGHGWQDPTTIDDFEVLPPDEPTVPPTKNPDRYEFVQAAKFAAGKPPGWIIKNVLPRAELVVVYGESGAGKSFLALDLMGAIARGVDWRGLKTTQGMQCGYIAAEGASGFRKRLNAYAQHHGVDLADLPLAVLAGAPNFAERTDVLDLGAAMRAYGRLDVLVVDTLAQVTAGINENSGEDMSRVITHCKTLHAVTGATIVLIHHSGKDASKGARGWSGIKGAVDAELEVSRDQNDRVVSVTKLKDGDGEGVSYPFRLLEVTLGMDEDGETFGSCVVDHTAAPARRDGPRGQVEVDIHKIVLDLTDVGESPTVTDVLTEYEGRVPRDPLASRDARKSAANRALRALIDRGIFVLDGVRIRAPELGEGDHAEQTTGTVVSGNHGAGACAGEQRTT